MDITLNNHKTESPMIRYLNLHYELTIARRLAQEKVVNGPRLAIVGGESSGISYSSRLLLTWAGKLNMRPVYVDLDTENSLFLDGTVGTCIYKYHVTTSGNIYKHCQKLLMVYGNRKIRTASFLNTARKLAKYVDKRLSAGTFHCI